MRTFWEKAALVVGMTFAAAPLVVQEACAQSRDPDLIDSGESDQGVQDYQEKGVYFGVGLGLAKSNQDIGDFNDNFLSAIDQQGFDVLVGTGELEDSDTAFSLTAGYNFNEYLGAEVSYINFGTVEYRGRAQVQMGLETPSNASASADIETQGIAVAGVGRLPVSETFAVRTRLGLILAKSDVDLSVNLPASSSSAAFSASRSDSSNETNLFFSVGATYAFENRWNLSLDYEILKRTGDDDFLDDIGVVSLGLTYRL